MIDRFGISLPLTETLINLIFLAFLMLFHSILQFLQLGFVWCAFFHLFFKMYYLLFQCHFLFIQRLQESKQLNIVISSKCKGDFFPTKHLEALDAQTCLQPQLGEFARADEAREKNWARKSFSP